MEVREVSAKEYRAVIANPTIIFNSVDFNLLNSDKCEEIKFLLFKDTKIKMGICGGVREKTFYSPFSAPFGGFSFTNNNIDFDFLDSAIETFEKYLFSAGLQKIHLTLPPSIYNDSQISKQINSFFRNSYHIEKIDVNYHFDTTFFTDNYISSIKHSARKNLNAALKNDISFSKCESPEEKSKAYDIIQINRSSKGFPLRMTKDLVFRTENIIPADFFLAEYKNTPIASAIVFHVAKNIVQVVYWGDNPEFSMLKPMNYLSYKIFEFYSNNNITTIDIGPSTENSIPNYGLCSFKESIGCDTTLKFSFKKNL